MLHTCSKFGLLVFCLVLAAGCNVYEGLYEEGESDDPQVLLEDARIALQQNKPQDAVRHLRKAMEQSQPNTPLRKRVEIKLASAVLLAQDLDALSFSRIARKLSGDFNLGAAASKSQSLTCNFPTNHGRTPFDPREGVDFTRLGSDLSAEALAESQDLIVRVFSGDETNPARTFPCEQRALDQAVQDLQNQGLTVTEIAEALVGYAVARSTTAYLDVVDAGGDDAQFFYAQPPAGSEYVGICFPEAGQCEAATARVATNLDGLDCATLVLQKRALLLGSTAAQELANLARDGYEHLEAGLANSSCIAQ